MADAHSKQCTRCGDVKPLTEYHSRKDSPDGLRNHCKPCRSAEALDWVRANRERFNAGQRALRAKSPEAYKRIAKAYQERDKEHYLALKRDWVQKNPAARKESIRKYHQSRKAEDCARVRERQAHKLRATPAWADAELMADMYRLARIWMDATGHKIHIDHSVPLQSPLVCGLHCEANLSPMFAPENRRKSNKHWPDMP